MKRIVVALLIFCSWSAVSVAQEKNVLVFSKTKGYRHSSIEPGIAFFKRIAGQENINFTFSEDADIITEENLPKFNAVVFLNTTGNILNDAQKADFERYIQAGGGFMGIHAAADCEYSWPWYNKLVGAWFASHPGGDVSNIQMGKMTVHDQNHPSTRHLPETFERKDEFYDFRSLQISPDDVLITVDEKSYKKGRMGDWHPMAWYHDFDGGKVFYTNFGHVESTFDSEPDMQKHMIEGLKSVLADHLDYSKAHSQRAPEENRFVKTTLANNLFEPTELVAMPNGKIMVVERRGDVKMWLPEKEEFKTINHIDVFDTFEYGLMGVGIDPYFSRNNYVYLYYTPNTDAHNENYLSRFTYNQEKDELMLDTEVVMLKVGVKGNECCHTGGSIDWDGKGNLYLSTGDDTNPFASDGFGPMDFQPGRAGWDAMRSAANTNDLRGKILRIKPKPDGTYAIPPGNLYPEGVPNTRPEIFVMGCRNPYRIGVDKRTGYLYWGDIGPDAGKPNPERGPEGYVEFNRTKEPGFFGWPMVVGNNFAYNHYDFATKVSGEKYDVNKPINDSPNNTGLKQLPAVQKPFIYYSYGESKEFPLMGSGGCNPMAGPVYYSGDYGDSEHKFPSYFDGKFFAYEWMRDWIVLVDFDDRGNIKSMERFMPNTRFYHPMDMTFGKDGELYVLEYGLKWFAQNQEAALSKIEFNASNRPPVVKIAASKSVGAAPLKVDFSSEGTLDYDGDDLSYQWDFSGGAMASNAMNPSVEFKTPGSYQVTLTVTDAAGASTKESMQVEVGNEVPDVNISVAGNQSFFTEDKPINYKVSVKDKEDGTLGKGIKPTDVVVSINYLEGFDKNAVTIGHQQNLSNATGRRLMEDSDCMSCHQADQKSIGPSFKQIAGKYNKSRSNVEKLANKIIGGGGGVWGEVSMAAHPDLKPADAQSMVNYILSINDAAAKSLPASGTYAVKEHKGKKEGAYIIQASYLDKGGKVIGPQAGTGTLALRSTHVPAIAYDITEGTMKFEVPQIGEVVVANNNSWIAFKGIDLTGIKGLKVGAMGQSGQTAGGILEVRAGGPEGTLLAQATISDSNMNPVNLNFSKAQKGIKDVYLVFKNPDAEGKPLFGVSFLEFKL